MGYTTIGKNEIKVDVRAKVTGRARYVDDLEAKGMLIGKVLRSPYAHARIVKIDTSEAEALPGVKAVVSYKDTAKVLFNAAGFPPSEGAILLEDQYVLADKARFVGDPIAAVAAVDEETASKALKLIQVEYEQLPIILDGMEAFNNRETLLHENLGDDNICGRIPVVIGDIDGGFADADYIFEDTFSTQKVFQCSMEPCGAALAEMDANGRIRIETSTQMPHLVRSIIAKSLGMPIRDIQIIKPYVGGAFGSRLGTVNEPIAALLAKKTRRPVKLVYNRLESFYTESRHPAVMTLKTGVKKDGTFTARYMKAVVDTGAYATHGPSLTSVLGGWFLAMYKASAIHFDGYTVYTNTPPCGAFRGYGNPQVTFAVESQVDQIAEALGLDPIEIRLKNAPKQGETWVWSQMPIESCGLEECMAKGAQSIGWEEKRQAKAQAGNRVETKTKRRGVGIGYMMHVSGARPMLHEISTATVKVNEDGSVNLTYANSDSGQGSATALSQICAETLGVKFEDVIITQDADTDVAGFDIGSHASRQVYSGGYAVQKAAEEAKQGLLEQAALMMDCTSAELDSKDGYVFKIAAPEEKLTIGEVSTEAHFGKHGHQIMGNVSTEPPGNPPVYAVQFAEVEVDVETGKVEVIKVAAAHDTGVAIHPHSVEGQIEGAIQQGMGFALTEQMLYAPDGRPLNPNFSDYKLLTSVDLPEIDTIVVQAATQTGAYGSKSIGESGLVATAPAIANAVYDAIGVRIKDLPITPEKVLAALKAKEEAEASERQIASDQE